MTPAEATRPVALVTGSARRTGRAMVERLAAEGYAVWVHYLGSKDAAQEVADGITSTGGVARIVQGDVGRPDEAAAIIDRVAAVHGRLDVLVNNVGIYRTGRLADFDRRDFRATLAANLLGPFDLIQRALPLFPAAGASVVNLGVGGLEHNGAGGKAAAYNCSKAGLLILTRSFAEELGPRGIRVNMISPGHIDNSVDLGDCADIIPLGRPASTDDICDALMWLVGPRASYVTGQNLQLDGGLMMSLRPDRWSGTP